jgi:hypothetical protein
LNGKAEYIKNRNKVQHIAYNYCSEEQRRTENQEAHKKDELLEAQSVEVKEHNRSLPGGPSRIRTMRTCNCVLQGPPSASPTVEPAAQPAIALAETYEVRD